MTPEEYIAEQTKNIPAPYGCAVSFVAPDVALEAVRMARMQIRGELEQEKQKLLKLIWSEHDKEVMQLTAHKLNKVISCIDDLTAGKVSNKPLVANTEEQRRHIEEILCDVNYVDMSEHGDVEVFIDGSISYDKMAEIVDYLMNK